MPGSETPPPGWTGWPEGKRFALILTHDVERSEGFKNCLALMQLEKALGFRSAFNFVPEGTYRFCPDLQAELVRNGFEIGVHDLKHDGKLFFSRTQFVQYAKRINQYLKNWGAVGFRSGFMMHKLDWLHDLNIQYDASTFDTDPFEPEPDGMSTIFPFCVSKEKQSYVELPYTLPQDSTLFLLLGEKGPLTWIQKLDWLAHHGGMALLNVHPDYIQFNGEPRGSRAYPVEYYVDFLKHVRSRYADQFWHPLPREAACFARGFYSRQQPKP